MTRQFLSGRRIGEISELNDEISAWADRTNAKQRGVDWQPQVDQARTKLTRLYPKIKNGWCTSVKTMLDGTAIGTDARFAECPEFLSHQPSGGIVEPKQSITTCRSPHGLPETLGTQSSVTSPPSLCISQRAGRHRTNSNSANTK